MKTSLLAGIAGVVLLSAGSAGAQDCSADKAGGELSHDEAQQVYECLKGAMAEGYRQGDKKWIPAEFVENYRDWTLASTAPAAPGFHSGRFLLTWVNEAGYDEYVKFNTEDAEMPVGTVIAKESFEVGEDGKAKIGPLFLMQKVEEEKTPETAGWYYMMVAANGAPQAVPVMDACNACHSNFGEAQDYLGYPVEEVRVSAE